MLGGIPPSSKVIPPNFPEFRRTRILFRQTRKYFRQTANFPLIKQKNCLRIASQTVFPMVSGTNYVNSTNPDIHLLFLALCMNGIGRRFWDFVMMTAAGLVRFGGTH
jgi:hypothetical protein